MTGIALVRVLSGAPSWPRARGCVPKPRKLSRLALKASLSELKILTARAAPADRLVLSYVRFYECPASQAQSPTGARQ